MPTSYDERLEVDIKRHTDPVVTWSDAYSDLYHDINTHVQLKDPLDVEDIVDALREVERLRDKVDDVLEFMEYEVR